MSCSPSAVTQRRFPPELVLALHLHLHLFHLLRALLLHIFHCTMCPFRRLKYNYIPKLTCIVTSSSAPLQQALTPQSDSNRPSTLHPLYTPGSSPLEPYETTGKMGDEPDYSSLPLTDRWVHKVGTPAISHSLLFPRVNLNKTA
jgi:hypothetical protein